MNTKQCPKCSKLMVMTNFGNASLTMPARWKCDWKCRCGHIVTGVEYVEPTLEEMFESSWECANRDAEIDRSIAELKAQVAVLMAAQSAARHQGGA